jgi:hypothetical protein
MVTHHPKRRGRLVAFLALHLVAVALTWRDINRRPAERVRGSKWMWRVATGLNTGGATAAYLLMLIGRRRRKRAK